MAGVSKEYWRTANCDEDCFHCPHPDCIWNGVSTSKEAKDRDEYARRILLEGTMIDGGTRYDKKRRKMVRNNERYKQGAATRQAWKTVQLALARDIKAARRLRDWDQVTAAKLHAIPLYLYASWERGVREIPEATLSAIYPELKGASAWAKRDAAAQAAGLEVSRQTYGSGTEI